MMLPCFQPDVVLSIAGTATKAKAPSKEKSEKRSAKSKANSAAKRQNVLNSTAGTEAYLGESAFHRHSLTLGIYSCFCSHSVEFISFLGAGVNTSTKRIKVQAGAESHPSGMPWVQEAIDDGATAAATSGASPTGGISQAWAQPSDDDSGDDALLASIALPEGSEMLGIGQAMQVDEEPGHHFDFDHARRGPHLAARHESDTAGRHAAVGPQAWWNGGEVVQHHKPPASTALPSTSLAEFTFTRERHANPEETHVARHLRALPVFAGLSASNDARGRGRPQASSDLFELPFQPRDDHSASLAPVYPGSRQQRQAPAFEPSGYIAQASQADPAGLDLNALLSDFLV